MSGFTICDKCFTDIINGKCSCGTWYEDHVKPPLTKAIEAAIVAYDSFCKQNDTSCPITGDHHTGSCIVLFKGTIEDCDAIRELLRKMKKENK
jgi:hypothetical protein